MNNKEKLKKMEELFKFDDNLLNDYPHDTSAEINESLIKAMSELHDMKRRIEKLTTMLPVESIPFAGNPYPQDELVCPCCNGNNLHPSAVIEGIDNEIRSEYADYTQLNFWCEGCPNVLGLRFRFHKGTTYMTWQINDESAKELS